MEQNLSPQQLNLLNEIEPEAIDSLSLLKVLYSELQHLQADMQEVDLQHKTLSSRILRKELEIGELMADAGLTKMEMVDGRQIKLAPEIRCSTSTERMPAIREYLSARGLEGIIKPDKLPLTEADIPKLPEELRELVVYGINTNTLKATLKEIMQQEGLDEQVQDLFKVHIQNKITLK